jgi:hypothetical protein
LDALISSSAFMGCSIPNVWDLSETVVMRKDATEKSQAIRNIQEVCGEINGVQILSKTHLPIGNCCFEIPESFRASSGEAKSGKNRQSATCCSRQIGY